MSFDKIFDLTAGVCFYYNFMISGKSFWNPFISFSSLGARSVKLWIPSDSKQLEAARIHTDYFPNKMKRVDSGSGEKNQVKSTWDTSISGKQEVCTMQTADTHAIVHGVRKTNLSPFSTTLPPWGPNTWS